MMEDTTQPIEQLWAVQSTESGALPRVCALSAGLRENLGLLAHLQPHLSYALPADCEPQDIDIKEAPISLSFLKVGPDKQHILLHKMYAEKATEKQHGTYFIHLLTGLPDWFSALDAIVRWRTTFWRDASAYWLKKKSDFSIERWIDPPSVQVKRLQTNKAPKLLGVDCDKVNMFLPYLLQAHLLQQGMLQVADRRLPPLYIAASSDQTTYLIHALLQLLPQQFQQRITFNTYENDRVQGQQALLLGVQPASLPPHLAGYTEQDTLPADYYKQALILDCITGQTAPLPASSAPQLPIYYARYATRCWAKEKMKELHGLFEYANNIPALTIELFLQAYADSVYSVGNGKRTRIEQLLNQPDHNIVKILKKEEETRLSLIDCALLEGEEFRSMLIQRLMQVRPVPELEKDVCTILIQAAETDNLDLFITSCSLLESLANSPDTWIHLLRTLMELEVPKPPRDYFIDRYWTARATLLELLSRVALERNIEYERWIKNLVDIPLKHLPQFITLSISPAWIFFAITKLLKGDVDTTPVALSDIEQLRLGPQERRRCEQVLQYNASEILRDEVTEPAVLALLRCIIHNGCQNKLPIVFALLDKQPPVSMKIMDEICSITDLGIEEWKVFSGHYCSSATLPSWPAYISLYPESFIWRRIVSIAAQQHWPEKMEIFDRLVTALTARSINADITVVQLAQTCEELFAAVAFSPEAAASFLERYGSTRQYAQSPTLCTIAQNYGERINTTQTTQLATPDVERRLQVFSTYLDGTAQQLASDWLDINKFLHVPVPVVTIASMQILADRLSRLRRCPGSIHNNLSIAQKLAGAINDTFQLSVALSFIGSKCEPAYSENMLRDMVDEIHRQYAGLQEDSHNFFPTRKRLAVYTQFILTLEEKQKIATLLQALLKEVDSETFNFLDKVALTWPATSQQRWQYEKQAFQVSIPQPPPVLDEEDDFRRVVSLYGHKESYDDEFPPVWRALESGLQKKGTQQLALLWFQYSVILSQHKNAIGAGNWRKMQLASAFYLACQAADAHQPPLPGAEQKLLQIADTAEFQQLFTLTRREKKRIALARERALQPAISHNQPYTGRQ